jgi:hypothetical protein
MAAPPHRWRRSSWGTGPVAEFLYVTKALFVESTVKKNCFYLPASESPLLQQRDYAICYHE